MQPAVVDDESEREFVERVLSVLTGRQPVPAPVGRVTCTLLAQLRKKKEQQEGEGDDLAAHHGDDEQEYYSDDQQLLITDRSLCGSDFQRELVVQYLLWVLRHDLALPSSVLQRQSWQKPCRDGASVMLTNVVVSFAGRIDTGKLAEGEEVPKPGDIIVGAHHDVQNNQSHCWMPPDTPTQNAQHHHHHHDGEEDAASGEAEAEEEPYVATAGADDNGSGVVGCLALVRRLARQAREGWQPKRTIRVVLFDGEEPGLRCSLTEGSAEFYRRSTIKGAERPIDFALIIDMIGAPPSDRRVGLVLSHQEVESNWLASCAAEATPELLVTPADSKTRKPRGVFCLYASDSRVFAAEGLPTVLMCNTHLGALPDFYHNELDTIDNIDWSFLLRCVDLAEALVKSRDARGEH